MLSVRRDRPSAGTAFAGLALAVLAGWLGVRPVAAQNVLGYLVLEEQLVSRQLDQDLTAYRAARGRADRARDQVGDAASSLDEALEQGASDDRVASLEGDRDQAIERMRTAQKEVDALLERIVDRRQRLALVREEIQRRRGASANLPDPLTGTWQMSMEGNGPERAAARSGLLDLELDGTEVHGTLGMEDGSFGSVRGTFVRGKLVLERVSAGSGLDLILEGDYDPGERALRGTWRSTVAGLGKPGGGTWRAVRTVKPESQ